MNLFWDVREQEREMIIFTELIISAHAPTLLNINKFKKLYRSYVFYYVDYDRLLFRVRQRKFTDYLFPYFEVEFLGMGFIKKFMDKFYVYFFMHFFFKSEKKP